MSNHQKIENLPWSELGEQLKKEDTRNLSQQALDILNSFGIEYNLKHRTELYPQLLAIVAAWGHDNDLKRFLKDVLADRSNLGIFYFITSSYRALASSQYKTAQYSKATPLFLAAHKLYNNVSYESWRNTEGLALVTGYLNETMFATVELTKNRLVELREIGLKTKSGSRLNQIKNSKTTFGLYGLQGTELDGLDQLTKMMLCQTWCYHPANRHSLMVTQTENWDLMPEALVSDEVFENEKTKKQTQVVVREDLPWN